MSPPTRQFHRLSIGQNMPETRAQSSRTARAAGRPDPSDNDEDTDHGNQGNDSSPAESSSQEDGDEDESSEEESTRRVRMRSGITYDLSHLNAESEAKALLGLMGQFEVVNCSASSSGYDFQLLDRPRVHVGPGSPTCTCSTFQGQPGVACHHIFNPVPNSPLPPVAPRSAPWLLPLQPPSTEVALSHDGRPRVHPSIEDLLKGKLEAVADRLNWPCLRNEGDGRSTGMTRAQKVRDVLSAFSPKILPEDFRQDLAETTAQTRTPEQCVVQGDFEATIFRLAVHDDSVFTSMCKAMPSGACAAIYFDKVQEQSRRLLADFDRYCATGERPADPSSPGGGLVEVDEVVQHLRRSVSRIRANVALRAPYGSEGAAKALVSILEAIAARNKDALEGNTWGRASFHGEDEDQRNLYHLLIGSEDMDLDPDAELFVLDALHALPPADLTQYLPKLLDIRGKIEVNRAPKLFLLRLGALIRVAESASAGAASASGQMGSGQKRPAAGNSGGNSKRSR
ncbi:uncharacterized protein N7482_005472 [Penicillium canariense]|uniref:SWIM-type domain-containing protein n=1 Tax=Penicillium canariense TaxID=189055 RepID=A0A9W9LN13_9EURO|nr:uncharacterized protein N7482_005472 [Penicillium canariense]KAJ5166691.1 hypothetical protein N7482_005472 [Penicillium canariense]